MSTPSAAFDGRVAAIWKVESPRLIARLLRFVGDLDTAEEIAQDAFVAALEKWRSDGIADNPAAWLQVTGRQLAIDRIRRRDLSRTKYQQVAAETPETVSVDINEVTAGPLADDLLGLVFMACHPILSPDARSSLTLKLVCGLDTAHVARAFLTPETTMAQRIVRAKRTLAAANIRFELPESTERSARLAAVREVIYLVFNEGYIATSGERWFRSELCDEGLRLARMLASLTPRDPETLGLLALLEIQASRLPARTDRAGRPVLLEQQDRSRWDRLLIRRGLALIDRIDSLGGLAGPYALQAAIAACHARAFLAENIDWERIVALYDGLMQLNPSPVVQINRAVAVGRAFGPSAGLELVAPLLGSVSLQRYAPLFAVAGDLYCSLGDHGRARELFLRAADTTANAPEKATMQGRAAQCVEHLAAVHTN